MRDELAQVTRAFDRMRTLCRRRGAEAATRRSVAPVAEDGRIGRLAGGVAHDFNNLLTVIKGTATCCLRLQPADSLHKSGVQIVKAADARHADAQLLPSADAASTTKVVDLNALVSRCAACCGFSARRHRLHVSGG